MNKDFDILDMDRVKEILAKNGAENPADYFIKRGYVPTKDWGWVKAERLNHCLKNNLIKSFDDSDTYSFVKDCGVDPSKLHKFLQGDIDDLRGAF